MGEKLPLAETEQIASGNDHKSWVAWEELQWLKDKGWYLYIGNLESQIDAMRDFMALLYLGIREGRDEAFEALDDRTKHLINEVWFERLEEDAKDETE